MSEQPTEGQEQAGNAQMPLQVLMQYIKDLSFENPNAPQSLLPSETQPTSGFTVAVDAKQIADEVFEVELKIRAEVTQEQTVAFIVELAYAGVFKMASEVPQEHHAPMLLIEGARLLFPFARSIIANATRDGGYMPFLLPVVDFVDVFRKRVAAAEAEQAAGQA
jgi:preprotein translocase subunit SecB